MLGPQLVAVYQFRVVLRGICPLIWRRLLLRSDQSVADLHYAIQIAMGWSDSHLPRFHIHGKDYGVAHEGGMMFDDDLEKIRLGDFEQRLRERFLCQQDMYDSWNMMSGWRRNSHTISGFIRSALVATVWHHQRIAGCTSLYGRRRSALAGVVADDAKGGAGADGGDRARVLRFREHSTNCRRSRSLVAALERVKAHRASRPDRIDRQEINQRLAQYARGDRNWLFCETIMVKILMWRGCSI
jgi:Plasmid pRiA4b ORF-3-like protein